MSISIIGRMRIFLGFGLIRYFMLRLFKFLNGKKKTKNRLSIVSKANKNCRIETSNIFMSHIVVCSLFFSTEVEIEE